MKLIIFSVLALSGCANPELRSIEFKEPSGPVTLSIVSPKADEVVSGPDVTVKLDLKNYEVKPEGQHVHIILDNEAYEACFDVTQPFVLKNVSPGAHTIRAFPSRAWHESIKEPSAFALVNFSVGKAVKPLLDPTKPLLTYSRPKGKYEGEKAQKILFDFWVSNTSLTPDGHQVKWRLDNEKPQFITEWKPSYFENLSSGTHKLEIQLVDKKGKFVKGPFNKTVREFEVAK